ncbi:unnamed protein product [Acanthoscelides obtectus]|uniref:DDE Tnp4 domain-containing protein n=1 Tax=Acanthoscelides obtectus TaxID=200917 RepID=A0A9P0PTE4_ACAOB|nr:unnamed protein product [Acanthoscelides obtectus]CAK1681239.1 Protein ALP1-like [Acanthoscelides obtectus]
MDTALLLLLENPLIKRRLAKKRRFWTHNINRSRERFGEFFHLYKSLQEDSERFYRYFRMKESTFSYILEKVEWRIKKQNSNFRKAISPIEKLALTSRFLATGLSYRALADSFRMGFSTVASIVKDVCTAIWEELQPIHLGIPSEQDLLEISRHFYKKWNFPNCFGCIDGKHIRIRCPSNTGTSYYNYKQYFSIVLQAVADANCRFIFIDTGAFGKQSDGGIFRESALYQHLVTGKLNIPADRNLPNSDTKLPYVLLGDEAYPLLNHLLKPYPRKNLDAQKTIFNYRLSRARRVVECAFGILAAKWRILTKAIETSPENAEKIVNCICVLHNIIIDKEGIALIEEPKESTDSKKNRKNNSSTEQARDIRNCYMQYFNNEGAVPFQYNVL